MSAGRLPRRFRRGKRTSWRRGWGWRLREAGPEPGTDPGADGGRGGRRRAARNAGVAVVDGDRAIEVFVHLDPGAHPAAALGQRQPLNLPAVKAHGVVGVHQPFVLEAKDAVQFEPDGDRLVGTRRIPRRDGKLTSLPEANQLLARCACCSSGTACQGGRPRFPCSSAAGPRCRYRRFNRFSWRTDNPSTAAPSGSVRLPAST
jgi:hypothetical protein